jgi:hypothetical protein
MKKTKNFRPEVISLPTNKMIFEIVCLGKLQATVVRCWEETELSPTVSRVQEEE